MFFFHKEFERVANAFLFLFAAALYLSDWFSDSSCFAAGTLWIFMWCSVCFCVYVCACLLMCMYVCAFVGMFVFRYVCAQTQFCFSSPPVCTVECVLAPRSSCLDWFICILPIGCLAKQVRTSPQWLYIYVYESKDVWMTTHTLHTNKCALSTPS